MARAKICEATHDGNVMHVHTEGRCRGIAAWLSPGETFGLHLPGSCANIPKARRAGPIGEDVAEEEIEGPKGIEKEIMPKEEGARFGTKECCGSKGPKHMKDCPTKKPLEQGGKPLEGYLVDYRSDCHKGLVVPGKSGGYRCLECDRPCQPVKV